MVFVAVAWLGWVWELYVGAALFVAPQLVKYVQDRFPNVPWLVRALPGGIVKTVMMMFVGTWFAKLVATRIANPATFVTEGFVVLSIPGLVLGTLSYFALDGRKWELNWALRIGGIVVLALGVAIVQKVVAIS